MGSSQGKIADTSLPDRISDLPSNIIDCIFDRLPIRDAIATSVLCKESRHMWRRIPNLVFDKEFVDDVICRRTRGQGEHAMKHEYSNIIGKILLLHLGPIHKFVLHIPYFFEGKSLLDLSSWMLFISQNDVKEIIIEDKYTLKFRLPLYVFQCNELQNFKLDVRAFDLYLLRDFRGFCNLLSLDLSGLPDGDVISNLVSKCPLLERLSVHLIDCRLLFDVDAPRLKFLNVHFSGNAFFQLRDVRSLTAISIRCDYRELQWHWPNMINYFNSMPKVETVTLQPLDLHTMVDVPQDTLKSILITLHNHKNLTLVDIVLPSKASMSFILFLLCRSPNLQKLNLGIYPLATNVDDATLHSLDAQITEPLALNSLLTVKIKGLLGSKFEIRFIKLILSCSTVLKTLHLSGAKNLQNQVEFSLITEILQCPRPSCQAQVIYSKHPGDSSIFDF